MANYYLSKNYNSITSAGNKAKTDNEKIMSDMGFKSAGLKQTTCKNKVTGFILTLAGILKMIFKVSANDTVVIQYPYKKYYTLACNMIHRKKGKVITIVHDLGSFRRKKLSPEQEIRRLSHSDCLIVHNNNMKNWLLEHNYSKPMVIQWIWDYLSDTENNIERILKNKPIIVTYAGSLSYRKNRFIYDLNNVISSWQFELYGSGFETDKIQYPDKFLFRGYCPSNQLIETACGHFGLLWDGDSTIGCTGNFGEYLQFNNPHKASLYVRCHLPIITWEKAAMSTFILQNRIGICVNSLEELDTVLPSISVDEYEEMTHNIKEISKNVASGYYLKQALNLAFPLK